MQEKKSFVKYTVFLFGEAERGEFCSPLRCQSLSELADTLGNPPGESLGIYFAVQAILYQRDLIFFRVKEEGFSIADYMKGIHLLQVGEVPFQVHALGLPGVGDAAILELAVQLCVKNRTLLLLTQQDLYDYLTSGLQL